MADISELTQAYIENTFYPTQQQQIFDALTVLDKFEVRFYEDDLENLIAMDNLVEKDNIRDLFLEKVSRHLQGVLEEHAVILNEDQDITLRERLEICQFLLLVQDLEDKTLLSYRLYSDDNAKSIFVSLLARYSYLEEFRAMEIVQRIGPNLIEAMKRICKDTEMTEERIDAKQREEWKIFNAFINKQSECAGFSLVDKGYNKIDFHNLYSLEKKFIDSCLTENEQSNRPQAALDSVSILLMCKDTYQLPLMEFDKQIAPLLSNGENVTAIKYIAGQILKDFSIFKEAYLKQQELNQGEQRG